MPFSLKKIFLGSPLRTTELHEQRLGKLAALPVFASDALSSTAYATEEVLLALAVAGTAFFHLSLPVAICIVVLLAIVATSYSQTIHAYPSGGGAYIVAKENLGVTPGLVAAAALLIDYVLTVAVSVAAGIAALTSAFPSLYSHRAALCLLAIFGILLANLRGVRESAALFGGPVYLFIFSAYLLIAGGFVKLMSSGANPVQAAAPEAGMAQVGVTWLFLRAFASGCTALTGVEAISNGVQAFKQPVSKNASQTLFIMAGILGSMFLGVTILSQAFGIAPKEGNTVLSQLNETVFGRGAIYQVIQLATLFILILAANTSFADFPRLSSILAKDRFAPRQLANLGDRLVFSNGVILLALAASALIVFFRGEVHALIPLYMVGVFVSFTLSQAGMVVHWLKLREPGFRRRMALNATGAVTTAIVLCVVAFIKFTHGAYMVIAAIPLLVMVFRKTREHYFKLSVQVSLSDFDRPKVARHTVIVPVSPTPNRVVLSAVEYAKSVSHDVLAVTVNVDAYDHEEVRKTWKKHVDDVDLIVLDSPYRSVLKPLLRFIDEVEDLRSDDKLTVLLPEIVPARWWHNLFHNQTSLFLKGALLFRKNIVVTSVPYHLEK
ncbi:MAG: APC family permease [Acidobacteria bacterium]|nr:APC family permease [Acidobacteriota bacterium]MCL5287456.1 APC family permease [Acidobacteriota bacterium]